MSVRSKRVRLLGGSAVGRDDQDGQAFVEAGAQVSGHRVVVDDQNRAGLPRGYVSRLDTPVGDQ